MSHVLVTSLPVLHALGDVGEMDWLLLALPPFVASAALAGWVMAWWQRRRRQVKRERRPE